MVVDLNYGMCVAKANDTTRFMLLPIKLRKMADSIQWFPSKALFDFVKTNTYGPLYKLLLDCPTRWNSTFTMLDRVLNVIVASAGLWLVLSLRNLCGRDLVAL